MDLKANNEALVREWRKRYGDLREEKQRLYNEMMQELKVRKQEKSEVQQENLQLRQSVKTYVAT
jgi:thiaminase